MRSCQLLHKAGKSIRERVMTGDTKEEEIRSEHDLQREIIPVTSCAMTNARRSECARVTSRSLSP